MRNGKFILLLLLLCLVLGGCGKQAEPEETVEEIEETVDYVALYQSMPVNELFTSEWKRSELKAAEHYMALTDYVPNVFFTEFDTRWMHTGYCADSKNMYSLDTFYEMENGSLKKVYNYLYILNGISREAITITYTDENITYLSQPFVVGGRVFAVTLNMDEAGVMQEYFVVELLPDGILLGMANVCDIVAAKQMLPKEYYVTECQLYFEPASERYYLISPEENQMFVIDRDGEELPDLELSGEKIKLQILAATEEGKLIFLKSENGQSTIFFYDSDEIKELFVGEDGPEQGEGILSVDAHGNLLFVYNGKTVVNWNTKTGEQEKVYSVDFEGSSIDCILRNENGELLILKDHGLQIVTEKGPAKQVTISIKPFMYYSSYFDDCLKRYEQTHPGVFFDLQETSEWGNRDRDIAALMTEIAAGGGPDMLLLDREYMLAFNKNECLMDLSNVLSDSTAQKLIPGVYDYGRAKDGTIKLLSCYPDLKTVFVNRKYLHNGSWTVSELVDLIEEREAQGDSFESLIEGVYHPFLIFITGIYNSEFLDVENGTCDFDNELFVKVLEISKRYCEENSNYNASESYRKLKKDKLLMFTPMTTNIRNYSEACAALGEEFVTAGYPSTSGNGNYMNFSMGYAINKNSENYEVIADFLNWMFSMECVEMILEVPIRTDSFEGRVVLPSESSLFDKPCIRVDSKSVLIEGKEDGTAYTEEYMQLLQESRYDPKSAGMSEVTDIIWEEANAFFEGTKTAKEVARVIQSRVSLYLME